MFFQSSLEINFWGSLLYQEKRNGRLDDLEGASVNTNGVFPSTNHSAISDTAKVQNVKSQKVVPNGTAMQAGIFQSDQRTGRRTRRQKASNKLADGKYPVTPPETENSKSQLSGTNGERHSETLRNNGDVGTKTLRQLQAEDDDEERFQADMQRAVLQSLGSFSTSLFIYLISCLTVNILRYFAKCPFCHYCLTDCHLYEEWCIVYTTFLHPSALFLFI
jgi:hypothetical protein